MKLFESTQTCKIKDIFFDGEEWVFCIDICKGEYKNHFEKSSFIYELRCPEWGITKHVHEHGTYIIHFPQENQTQEFIKILTAVVNDDPDFLDKNNFRNLADLVHALYGKTMEVCFYYMPVKLNNGKTILTLAAKY